MTQDLQNYTSGEYSRLGRNDMIDAMSNPLSKLWKTSSLRVSVKVALLTVILSSLFGYADGSTDWTEPLLLAAQAFILTEAADFGGTIIQRYRHRQPVTVQQSAMLAGLCCLVFISFDITDPAPSATGVLLVPAVVFALAELVRYRMTGKG